MQRFHHILTSLCTAVLVIFMGFATPVQAIAPAGTSLSITVTVSHDKDDGEPEEAEAAGVTVGLSPVDPTLSSPADQGGLSGGEIVYNYTLTTNANGPYTYHLYPMPTVNENTSFSVPDGASGYYSFRQNGEEMGSLVTLGATAVMTAQSAGETIVVVPTDGGAILNVVNDIQANDTVVIGSGVYEVDDISTQTKQKTIFLKTPLVADVNVGDLIAERLSFQMVIQGAEIVDPNLSASFATSLSATIWVDGGPVDGLVRLMRRRPLFIPRSAPH